MWLLSMAATISTAMATDTSTLATSGLANNKPRLMVQKFSDDFLANGQFKISPDKRLVARSDTTRLVWYEASTLRELGDLTISGAATSRHPFVFSADSQMIFLGHSDRETMDVIKLAQGEVSPGPSGSLVDQLALSPDGRWLLRVTGSFAVATVVDLPVGQSRTLESPGVGESISHAVWLPDSSAVLLMSTNYGVTVRNKRGDQPACYRQTVWRINPGTGQVEQRTVLDQPCVSDMSLGADGRSLLFKGAGVFALDPANLTSVMAPPEAPVPQALRGLSIVATSDDRQWVLCAGRPYTLRHTVTGEVIASFPAIDPVQSIQMSSNGASSRGQFLSVMTESASFSWNLQTGQPQSVQRKTASGLADAQAVVRSVSANGGVEASTRGTSAIEVRRLVDEQVALIRLPIRDARVTALALDAKGKRLAVAWVTVAQYQRMEQFNMASLAAFEFDDNGADRRRTVEYFSRLKADLAVWDIGTQTRLWHVQKNGLFTEDLRFSPEGVYLSSKNAMNATQLFAADTGVLLAKQPAPDRGTDPVADPMQWLPDEQLLTVRDKSVLEYFDPRSGQTRALSIRPFNVNQLAANPSMIGLVSDRNTLRVTRPDYLTGALQPEGVKLSEGPAQAYAQAGNGELVMSRRSQPGRITLFDAKGVVRELESPYLKSLWYSEDGQWIVASDNCTAIRIWRRNDLDHPKDALLPERTRQFGKSTQCEIAALAGGVGMFVSTSYQGIELWDLSAGHHARTVSNDGQWIRRLSRVWPSNVVEFIGLAPGAFPSHQTGAQAERYVLLRLDLSVPEPVLTPGPELEISGSNAILKVSAGCVDPSAGVLYMPADGEVQRTDLTTGQRLKPVRVQDMSVITDLLACDGSGLLASVQEEGMRCPVYRQIMLAQGGAGELTAAQISELTHPSGCGVFVPSKAGPDFLLFGKAVWRVPGVDDHRWVSAPLDTAVTQLALTPNSSHLIVGYADQSVAFLETTTLREQARMLHYEDGTWVVVAPDGRFDTNNLEEVKGLYWVLPQQPLKAYPLEVFMRDYYEPGLLAKVLKQESLPPVGSLAMLNLNQPVVQISQPVPSAQAPGKLTVQVRVAPSAGNGSTRSLRDLRLFRDGQLVGYEDGTLALGADGLFTRQFEVNMPTRVTGDVQFSAYAFNGDRVKSATAYRAWHANAGNTATVGKPGRRRMVVLSVGVNTYQNASWNLDFAARDAQLYAQTLTDRLKRSHQFDEVISKTLIADQADVMQASKESIRQALLALAGRAQDDRLPVLGPDDVLIFSFAGHGFVDRNGEFYLMPHNNGSGRSKLITSELIAQSISGRELGQWIRDIDARQMVMIMDACQSAASVENPGFKPGPLANPGLGQLAFEKGMKVLVATQSDSVALEGPDLQQGLLSYVLLSEGLVQRKADYRPKDRVIWMDEWLRYSVDRVPELAEQLIRAQAPVRGAATAPKIKLARRGAPDDLEQIQQKPTLFDFKKRAAAYSLRID